MTLCKPDYSLVLLLLILSLLLQVHLHATLTVSDYNGDSRGTSPGRHFPGTQPWPALKMCKEKICAKIMFLKGIALNGIICTPHTHLKQLGLTACVHISIFCISSLFPVIKSKNKHSIPTRDLISSSLVRTPSRTLLGLLQVTVLPRLSSWWQGAHCPLLRTPPHSRPQNNSCPIPYVVNPALIKLHYVTQ